MLPLRIRPNAFPRRVLLKPLLSPSHPISSGASLSSTSPSTTTSTPPKSITPSSSPHHNSLPTFLAHASRIGLSPTSTVYTGTYYEYLCQHTLPRLGFHSLTRTGGRADHGIDLVGLWTLPSLPYPLRVLIQCKATKAKQAPERIRELEGALVGAPEGWRGANTVGVMCAKQAATRGVREAIRRCGIPVVWTMIEEDGGMGRVKQVLWNEKVAVMGAEGVDVGVRYVVGSSHHAGDGATAGGLEKEAILLWEGREWEPGFKGDEGRRVDETNQDGAAEASQNGYGENGSCTIK